MMSPSQLEELMENSSDSELLILDLRVSPQYAQSRIKGALNLCIPTTLLKRATFNLQKLQTTFQGAEEQERFAKWQNTHHIVVYDAFSSDKRDALSAQNMIKKFTNEGYSGSMNILRGGFNTFAARYPELVDRSSAAPGGTGLALSASGGPGGGPSLAPVIGGVMLPAGSSAPNPFFNNIRQNQDLIGGVGQMHIKMPAELDPQRLPQWLRAAAEPADQGKKVSEKFLRIELSEQSRMKDAYSIQTKGAEDKVQISGIEKGGKNRYKDILPFEHARVKLEGRPEGVCDYVNASHLQSSRSHKRYIASQGPLPATFEDFWSVIWDQDVRVIVMLTAESEGGQLKCHPYWQGREFGPIKLRPLSEKKVSLDIDKHRSNSAAAPFPTSTPRSAHSSVSGSSDSQGEASRQRANTTTGLESASPTPAQLRLSNASSNSGGETPYVIIRKLALSHSAHPFAPMREITQLHYPSWPDFGTPAQPSHLLALVELANVMQRAALPLDVPSTIASAVAEDGQEGTGTPQPAKKAMEAKTLNSHDAPEPGEHVRPMLVHCSAGCGRTGAFCTVDSVIDMLKRQRLETLMRQTPNTARRPSQVTRDSEGDVSMIDPIHMSPVAKKASGGSFFPPSSSPKVVHPTKEDGIDTSWLNDDSIDLIAATVEDFRGQRLSMVQSLRQFVLCYETIIEWVWRVQERDAQGSRNGRGRSGSLIG
jgi:protein-tyrosine phosphatase